MNLRAIYWLLLIQGYFQIHENMDKSIFYRIRTLHFTNNKGTACDQQSPYKTDKNNVKLNHAN